MVILGNNTLPAVCFLCGCLGCGLPRGWPWSQGSSTVRGPSGNIWGGKESTVSQAGETESRQGSQRAEEERGEGARPGCARTAAAAGVVYLGGRRRGSLAVGGLRAEASSFGDRGRQGWVLGGRRGADYDRGGHGEVGALCGEGLLAPLLKWAARTGSEGHPHGPAAPHPETPAPTDAPEKQGWEPGGRGTERPGTEAPGRGGGRDPGVQVPGGLHTGQLVPRGPCGSSPSAISPPSSAPSVRPRLARSL